MPSPIDRSAAHARDVSPEARELLATARADMAAGCWRELHELLAPAASLRAELPELDVIFAECELRRGAPRNALEVLAELVPRLEGYGAPELLRRATNLLGGARFALGDVEEAERAYERVLELAYASGDLLLVAKATNNLGAVANVRGRRETALAYYRLALPAYQALDETAGLAETHHNIAITCRDLRRLEEAEQHEREALALAEEARYDRVRQQARVGLAELALLRGEAHAADAVATRAAVACASEDDPFGEANALRVIGEARAREGDTPEALCVLERALDRARRQGNRLIEAEILRSRARILERAGLADDARAAAAVAASILERMGARG